MQFLTIPAADTSRSGLPAGLGNRLIADHALPGGRLVQQPHQPVPAQRIRQMLFINLLCPVHIIHYLLLYGRFANRPYLCRHFPKAFSSASLSE